MNDAAPQVELKAGQKWRHHDGSPWEPKGLIALITDVQSGWVRYSIGTMHPDERDTETVFRKRFNLRVSE
jgi:hypothetical protein